MSITCSGACIECRDKDKETPLSIAAGKNHIEAVRLLLEHGADVIAKDIDDCTPLFRAAQEGSFEVIEVRDYYLASLVDWMID